MKRGSLAVNFTLTSSEGEQVSLKELTKNHKVVLFFFPLAFSSVCTDQFCQLRDNMKLYNALEVAVVGISVDSFFVLKEFKKANNLNFTLLSDFNREVSRQFGCLYEDYYGMKGVSKRSAFVINKKNRVEYAEILEDADLLPDLTAIQKIILNK